VLRFDYQQQLQQQQMQQQQMQVTLGGRCCCGDGGWWLFRVHKNKAVMNGPQPINVWLFTKSLEKDC